MRLKLVTSLTSHHAHRVFVVNRGMDCARARAAPGPKTGYRSFRIRNWLSFSWSKPAGPNICVPNSSGKIGGA